MRRIFDQGTQPGFSLGVRLSHALAVSADWLGDDSQGWPPPASGKQSAAAMVERALTGEGLLGDLTEQERHLLADFRSLPELLQGEALGHVSGLSHKQRITRETGKPPTPAHIVEIVEAEVARILREEGISPPRERQQPAG